jgi:hypothetical protein
VTWSLWQCSEYLAYFDDKKLSAGRREQLICFRSEIMKSWNNAFAPPYTLGLGAEETTGKTLLLQCDIPLKRAKYLLPKTCRLAVHLY